MTDYYEDDIEIETYERFDEMISEYEKELKDSIDCWEELFEAREEESVFNKLKGLEKRIIDNNPRHSF